MSRCIPIALVAGVACMISGCMTYGETVVYQRYQTSADRCAQNETDACVAMLQSSCDAPARVCTAYAPKSQAQASQHLSQRCRANDDASCQALDAVACDNGDQTVCARLGQDYSRLYSSCKADNANDCETLSLSVWPKTQTDLAINACKNGDSIACRVASSSASAMTLNVNRDAQFATF